VEKDPEDWDLVLNDTQRTCPNCGRQGKRIEFVTGGPDADEDALRCIPCHNWRKAHHEERPPEMEEARIRNNGRSGGKNGCRNPACGLQEGEFETGIGFDEERRCLRCYKYRSRSKGVEWLPKALRKSVRSSKSGRERNPALKPKKADGAI
jgi:hypothetical protein